MRAFALLLLVLCSTPAGKSAAQIVNDRPNIVLMMADDMGIGDTSAYQDFTGNRDSDQIQTPNMERLARRGVRFTDAHTPSSRCSPTRYGLLTGRYPWRNRLKHWVLFGSQGDPMIEADRPTIGTLLQSHGYRTAMVGKWHVGLRYRQSSGRPAAGWADADLTQPMYDTPLDHGFDYCRFTSRSHGTSGPGGNPKRPNSPDQSVGPGHIHGREVVGATGNGKELVSDGPDAYVLSELGGRHLKHAKEFLADHLSGAETSDRPFFLYYPSNSNHGPYTPDSEIGGVPVAGAARNVAGEPMDVRSDYIYENDVVLGQLIDFLCETDDPRNVGHKLIDNTIVIFTSDNGAEKNSNVATGPFRSHKGSAYEGGHRVPFLVSWPQGGIGDGDESTNVQSNATLIGLQDIYATFAEILGSPLANPVAGKKGGEDSVSVLAAWRGETMPARSMFFNDHKEATDPAAVALRLDDPVVEGSVRRGQWKMFLDARLLREGIARPVELYDLATDSTESNNLLDNNELRPLIRQLQRTALDHRTAGGHRLVPHVSSERVTLTWTEPGRDRWRQWIDVRERFRNADQDDITIDVDTSLTSKTRVTVSALASDGRSAEGFNVNQRGLGVSGGRFDQVDSSESVLIRFDEDVVVESVSIAAGNGVCGGFYRVGDGAPLAIYCVDADIDAKDQSGILSDIGVVRKGQTLKLESRPHHGVETPGRWRIVDLTFRTLQKSP